MKTLSISKGASEMPGNAVTNWNDRINKIFTKFPKGIVTIDPVANKLTVRTSDGNIISYNLEGDLQNIPGEISLKKQSSSYKTSDLLTIDETAEYLKISVSQFYRNRKELEKSGLQRVVLGMGSVRYVKSSISRMLKRLQKQSEDKLKAKRFRSETQKKRKQAY
jgi:predicted DNA-binding transcriptional regulator AlpA